MTESTPTKTSLLSIFASPLITSVGSIASIIALFLTIYYAEGSAQNPELTFSVNPAKLELVSAGQTSNLSVSFDGQVVQSDITTTQVAIWNHGKAPIRRSDVLQPIVIYTDPRTPILEAFIRKTSRDVIGFSLNSEEIQFGRIHVSWDVLEQGDGGLIEVIYAGSPEVDFKCEGVIVGQKEIISFQNRIGFQSPAEEYEVLRTANKRRRFVSVPFAALSLCGFVFTVLKIFQHESNDRIGGRILLVTLAVLLVILAGLFMAIFALSKYPIPPPGI